jgi:hypothetical protein
VRWVKCDRPAHNCFHKTELDHIETQNVPSNFPYRDPGSHVEGCISPKLLAYVPVRDACHLVSADRTKVVIEPSAFLSIPSTFSRTSQEVWVMPSCLPTTLELTCCFPPIRYIRAKMILGNWCSNIAFDAARGILPSGQTCATLQSQFGPCCISPSQTVNDACDICPAGQVAIHGYVLK